MIYGQKGYCTLRKKKANHAPLCFSTRNKKLFKNKRGRSKQKQEKVYGSNINEL